MRSITLLAVLAALLLAIAAPASQASNSPGSAPGTRSSPARLHLACNCELEWVPRQYWQWGWHQTPEHGANPVAAFWGDPDPTLVPASRWARKWHPPGIPRWRWLRTLPR